jgi:hypothetical protein
MSVARNKHVRLRKTRPENVPSYYNIPPRRTFLPSCDLVALWQMSFRILMDWCPFRDASSDDDVVYSVSE